MSQNLRFMQPCPINYIAIASIRNYKLCQYLGLPAVSTSLLLRLLHNGAKIDNMREKVSSKSSRYLVPWFMADIITVQIPLA